MARNSKSGKGRGGIGKKNIRKIKDEWRVKYLNRKTDQENKIKAKQS